jgi:hypothetical protein
MKRFALCLSVVVALVVPSCALRGDSAGSAAEPVLRALENVVTNRTGSMRLSWPVTFGGPLRFSAGGQALLGGVGAEYRVGSGAVRTGEWTAIRPALMSNDWQFVQFNVPEERGAAIQSIQRSVVCIEPDLMVVLDEISLRQSDLAVERRYWFVGAPTHDLARDEWSIYSGVAGVTARFFSSPGAKLATNPGEPSCVSFSVVPGASTIYQMAVLVGDSGSAKRSLAFKMLESDSAIGVRVHRDGLPTLVAFRKGTTTGEAVLTGLKFNHPVAVDVFKPKRK